MRPLAAGGWEHMRGSQKFFQLLYESSSTENKKIILTAYCAPPAEKLPI